MHGAERRQKSMKMSWKSGELIEGVLKRVGKAWRWAKRVAQKGNEK